MDPAMIQNQSEWVWVGPILQRPLPESFLPSLPRIAVDGGLRFCNRPAFVLGDGDSVTVPDSLHWIKKEDQNLTDLAFGFEMFQGWTGEAFHLVGFLGKRLDHELANLGECGRFLMNATVSKGIFFYDDHLRLRIQVISPGSHSLQIKGLFSVLSLEPSQISIHGDCEFRADSILVSPLSGRGISNRGNGRVQIKSDHPLLLVFETEGA